MKVEQENFKGIIGIGQEFYITRHLYDEPLEVIEYVLVSSGNRPNEVIVKQKNSLGTETYDIASFYKKIQGGYEIGAVFTTPDEAKAHLELLKKVYLHDSQWYARVKALKCSFMLESEDDCNITPQEDLLESYLWENEFR